MKRCEKYFCVKASYVSAETLNHPLIGFLHMLQTSGEQTWMTCQWKLLILVYVHFVKTHCMLSKLEAVINLQILWDVWCVLLKWNFFCHLTIFSIISEDVEVPDSKAPGVYRPPGARLTTTKRMPNQAPPEIFSDAQFPSLLATAKHVETRKYVFK